MLHYIPIDLPKINIPNNFLESKKAKELFTKTHSPYTGFHFIPFPFYSEKWNEEFLMEWQFLKDYITINLPFIKIVFVRISFQTENVGIHLDSSQINNPKSPNFNNNLSEHYNKQIFPYGYRILLKGNKNSLKLFSNNNNKAFQAIIPETTNCYCINSFKTKHSVEKDNDRCIVFIHGWLDQEKHNYLINKSIKKYQKYIISF